MFKMFYWLVTTVAAPLKKKPEKKKASDLPENVEMFDVQSALMDEQKDGDAHQKPANI